MKCLFCNFQLEKIKLSSDDNIHIVECSKCKKIFKIEDITDLYPISNPDDENVSNTDIETDENFQIQSRELIIEDMVYSIEKLGIEENVARQIISEILEKNSK